MFFKDILRSMQKSKNKNKNVKYEVIYYDKSEKIETTNPISL
jgi:hypothetical protein